MFGRIRNRRELADRLRCSESIGGASLVLRAYQEWDRNFVKYVEGPVVCCVMDSERDIVVLSRDRMGEQPLFYTLGSEGKLVFSDHPDSLLKTSSAEAVVSDEGMCELFGMGPARTPGITPLRDVRSLEPGCMLIGQEGKLEQVSYFSIRPEIHLEDEKDTICHTRALLEAAVQPVAELNPAVMLSGGLDSTALTAMLSRKRRVNSFSIEYRDDSTDFRPTSYRPERDMPYIDMAVRVFGTDHRTFLLEQAALADSLEQAVSARGFPGMADIDSSLLLFAGNLRKYTNIIVSGECGDEVFGGYPWFRASVPMGRTFPWSGSIELRERILKKNVRKKLALRHYVEGIFDRATADTGIDGSCEETEINLKRMQLLCLRYFMPNLQERAVRMCGHYSIEVLTPLCDERLVQYVFNVPWKMKFLNGQEKGLFRAAVRDLMPEALNVRKKSPYPKTCSPIYTEIIRGLTMAMLADREAPILEWIDEDYVRSLAESSLDPAETPWFGQLMAGPQMLAYLWQVNTWMRDRNITVSL